MGSVEAMWRKAAWCVGIVALIFFGPALLSVLVLLLSW